MNNVLLWIGGVLVVLLCALFAVPHFVNWNLYRGSFEEEASRLLSRDVRVSGSVTVRALPVPYVVFEKVRIGDLVSKDAAPVGAAPIPATGGEAVLRVERFTMGLSIAALLRGMVSASEVELVKPEVRARLGSQGANLMALLSPMTADGRGGSAFAVDAVRLTNGSITLTGQDGAETVTVTDITGDLTDPGGAGSPRFRGTATYLGEPRDVRISTAGTGPGAFKVKSAVRTLSSITTYGFDGTVSGLDGVLGYQGEFTAKLPIGSLGVGTDTKPAATPDTFELKAQVKGSASALSIDDVSLSFERDGRPQTISGTARASWTSTVEATAQLSSRWLDLDRVFAAEGGARPFGVVGWLAKTVTDAMPRDTRLSATLDVDSITLGGEQMTEVEVSMSGANGLVIVERASARVPGGGVIQISGRSTEDRRSFRGSLQARTPSIRRLLGWMATGAAIPLPRIDGPMIAEASVTVGATTVTLDQFAGEFGGQPVRGAAGYDWTTRPTVKLSIEAERLSVGSLLPDLISRDGVRALAGMKPDSAAPTASPHEVARLFNPQDYDLALTLRIGELDDGAERLRDVSVELASTRAELKVDRLSATSSDGLAFDVRGRVAGVAGDARGSLTIDLAADKAEAFARLAKVLGILDHATPADLSPLIPMRVSAKVTLGEDGTRRDRVVVDGGAASSRLYASGIFERGLKRWDEERIETYAAVVGPEARAAARLVAPAGAVSSTRPAASDDRIALRFAGVPRKGMHTLAGLTIGGAEAAFDGRVELPASGSYRATGRLAVGRVEVRDLLVWAGYPLAKPGGAEVAGTLEVERSGSETRLAFTRLAVGSATLGGTIAIAHDQKGPTIVAALAADRLAVASLIEPFLLKSAAPRLAADTVWPDGPIDLEALRNQRGQIDVAVRELTLGPSLVLPAARVKARLDGSGIEITELSGEPAGGQLTATLTLTPDKADARLEGAVTLAGVDLSRLGGTSSGTIGAKVALSGQGLSPSSIIRALSGTGTASLSNVVVAGVEPRVVQIAFDRAQRSDPEAEGADLSTLIAEALVAGRLAITQPNAMLVIDSGTLKVGDIRSETPQAAVVNRTTVDLAGLGADFDWRIAPVARGAPATRGRALPPIGVVYAGPLTTLGRMEPRIQGDDLQRELVVRRLERTVEELERLRREDEERARQETERRRQIEEQQAAAAEAALALRRAAEAAAKAALEAQSQPQLSPFSSGQTPPIGPAQTSPAPATAAQPLAPPAEPLPPPPAPQPAQRRSDPASAPIKRVDPLIPVR